MREKEAVPNESRATTFAIESFNQTSYNALMQNIKLSTSNPKLSTTCKDECFQHWLFMSIKKEFANCTEINFQNVL